MSAGLIVVPHLVRAVDGWVDAEWVWNPADPLAVWLVMSPGDRRGPRRWAFGVELLAAGLAATVECPAGLGDVRLHVDPTGDRLVIDLSNGRESVRCWADRWAADRFCRRVVVPEGLPETVARQIDAAVTWCLGGVR